MNQKALKALLDAIGSKEAPRGYDQMYSKAEAKLGRYPLSTMTLNAILAVQDKMKKYGSSACGRYQFLQSTLMETMNQMKLKGHEIWTPELQDRMAVFLLERRKLHNYLKGIISAEDFANNLAMEWASLPVVTPLRGQKRWVTVGESYYAGDGLNKSFHNPAPILKLIKALKLPDDVDPPTPSVPQIPVTEPGPQKPRGLLSALIELVVWLFKKG